MGITPAIILKIFVDAFLPPRYSLQVCPPKYYPQTIILKDIAHAGHFYPQRYHPCHCKKSGLSDVSTTCIANCPWQIPIHHVLSSSSSSSWKVKIMLLIPVSFVEKIGSWLILVASPLLQNHPPPLLLSYLDWGTRLPPKSLVNLTYTPLLSRSVSPYSAFSSRRKFPSETNVDEKMTDNSI